MGNESKADEQAWPKEPWRIDGTDVLDANGVRIMGTYSEIERYIACVNACAGIPTDRLKDAIIKYPVWKTFGVAHVTAEEKIRPGQMLEVGEEEGAVRVMDGAFSKAIADFHKKTPMMIACPLCGNGAGLKIIDGIEMKHWNEEADHKITITYECRNCGFEGVPGRKEVIHE